MEKGALLIHFFPTQSHLLAEIQCFE